MDSKEAGSLLDNLIAAFNGRIAELQDLVIARNSEWKYQIFKLLCIFLAIILFDADVSLPRD